MGDIALSGVTVTLPVTNIFVPQTFPLRYSFPVLSFGNASDTYPTHGIPLPPISKLGMERAIKFLDIEPPVDGYVYGYDRTARTANPVGPTGTIRIFQGAAQSALTVANHVGVAPTGNVATSGATSGGTPAGNVASASHSHDLVILANNAGMGTQVIAAGANTANHALVSNTAGGDTIVAGNSATTGGVANTTPANSTFTGAALATHTHTSGAFTGDAPANLVHSVSGGGPAAPLAELGHVAVAATTLRLMITGQ